MRAVKKLYLLILCCCLSTAYGQDRTLRFFDLQTRLPIADVQPVNIYVPGGRPVIVTVYPLQAASPPPPGPLENADVEDEDDVYDWYTFPRAVSALQRSDDKATIIALKSLALGLRCAATAGVVPEKWGGVFGQELAL